ncbi:phage tail spike protein [Pueribacillus sp. YX66]|uniref:phage tail spike protein n=1 Tax=Pueribacillus sp. YX66 TaxID=3229242 RepID=UPI00358D517F
MAETQLGSMRIGSVDMFDDDETGGGGVVVPIINIADGQSDEILDDITSDFIIDDTHRRSLEDTLETYAFYTFADQPFTQHLKDRNRIIIPDEDGSLQEFIIYESEKYRDTEGYKMYVVSTASYLDLKKANVIYPTKRNNQTASMMVGFALNNTGWRAGIIESDKQLSFEIEEHTDPFSLLKRIAKDFELELRFRVEHNGNRITGRFVDLLERVGEWRGREATFGRDLDGIRRIENTERIVTALVGLGPEREDGTRLEVLVEDDEALQRWGRPDPITGELRHLIEVYEPQSERQEMTLAELRQYTRTELNKRINAVVTYECSVVDLENVPGLEGQKIRFGDTIRIKDEKFNPPLYLEARVFEQERSIKSQAKKDIKLGDFIEYTEEEVYAIWRQLQREVKKRITAAELREYAEPKKIESETPPPIKEGENPIWVDTSGDVKVPHVVIGNEWVKMTPTTAEEVDAYTKQQTDDIAKDASRLKTGIIDVNQVPLRTSITGARIEWDGINGLVQYDADGNPVSWLDLDGNAHFENGYFKGEIYAESGHFSGDVTGATGTFGEVTVNEGDITVKDALSNVKALVTPLPNLLGDHNFEDLIIDWATENTTYNWYEMINPANTENVDYHIQKPYWRKSGSPKVARVPEYGNPDFRATPIFDEQAIVVRNANYVRQYIEEGIGAGGTYTISGYFKRHWGQAAGIPRFEVDYIHQGQLHTRLINHSYSRVPNDYTPIRFATNFTIPTNFQPGDYLDVKVSGGDNNWVQADGIQLVKSPSPTVYNPETTAYLALKQGGQISLWIGERYPTDTQTIYPLTPLSQCRSGWLIKWQAYEPGQGSLNHNYQYPTFIPKSHIFTHNGAGIKCVLGRGSTVIFKYLYVYDDRIVGHADNGTNPHNRLAMTEVLGV